MKTQKISGNVANIQLEGEALCLEFSESYPYYWIENRSASEVLISLEKEPVKGSDGSYSVSAGSNIRVSGGFDRKLTLLGSGEVQIIASIIAECPFKSAPAVSGGGGNVDNYVQSGTVTLTTDSYKGVKITFPVPFKGSPALFLSIQDEGYDSGYRAESTAFDNLDETGATIRAWGTSSGGYVIDLSCTVHWVAFGKVDN